MRVKDFRTGKVQTTRTRGHADGSGSYDLQLISGRWPSLDELEAAYLGDRLGRISINDREAKVFVAPAEEEAV